MADPDAISQLTIEDTYDLPLKDKVRQAARVTAGDRVTIGVTIRSPSI